MPTRLTTIDATTDDGDMAVVVAEPETAPPDGSTWPSVVIFIDAPGIRTATRAFMERLAANGYRVVTPDLHHRNGRLLHVEPGDMAVDPEARPRIMGWIASMTDAQIQHDLDCALAACGIDGEFAVIGFCLGARAAVRTMRRLEDRVVAGAGWHPSFLADDAPDSPHVDAAAIAQPLYLGIGDADQVQSVAMHQRFLDAVAELGHVDVTIWPGADHGYTWPDSPNYDEAAAEGSWRTTLDMFATAFER